MPSRRDILGLFKQTFRDWSDDHAPRLGAALAYYTALSIAPLLVITLRIVSLFFGTEASRAQLELGVSFGVVTLSCCSCGSTTPPRSCSSAPS